MRLRVLTLLLAALLPSMAQAQLMDRLSLPSFPRVNMGLKVGFAATGTYVTDAYIDGHELSEYTMDTQVGNFAAVQFRVNSRKLLFQTGMSVALTKSSFMIDKNSWNPEATSKDEMSESYSMISFSVPLQVGYHIVNNDPYCMSIFTGPRFRYIPDKYYTATFENMGPNKLIENPTTILMGWSIGLSVKIGRTFLDFEYEAVINNMSRSLSYESGIYPGPDIRLGRRFSTVAFSYGVMF